MRRTISLAGLASVLGLLAVAHAQDPEHRWTFNSTLVDSGTTGGFDAQVIDPDSNVATGGGSTQDADSVTLAGGVNNESDYIDLGSGLLSPATGSVTIELWTTPLSVQNWGRVFDFGNRNGNNGEDYLLMSWSRGGNGAQDRVEWRDVTPDIGGSRLSDETNAPYQLGTEYHIALTVTPGAGAGGEQLVEWYSAPSGNADLGTARGSFSTPNTLASLNDVNGWLGRSQWAGDATANADYNEARIFYRRVSGAELESYHDLGPDSVTHVDGDSDGLPQWWEVANGLNDLDGAGENGPTGDPDGDGADNATEFGAGTDPQNALSNPNDSDADGLDDAWEQTFFGGLGETGTGDPDRDGSNNEEEETAGTDPLDSFSFPDSDSDGLPDGYEIDTFGDLGTSNGSSDTDGDAYSDLEEFAERTDPTDFDFSPGKAALRHRWSFNGTLDDSVGGSNATIVDQAGADPIGGGGGHAIGADEVRLYGGARGTADYVQLGNDLIGGTQHDVTIEIWGTQHSVRNWSRIFSFGETTNEFVFASWTRGTDINTARVEYKNDGTNWFTDQNQSPVYALDEEYHIVVQLDNDGFGGTEMTLYKNGAMESDLGPNAGTTLVAATLADLVDTNDWLGRSQFGDDTADASYNEVRIWNGLVNPKVLERYHDLGPDDVALPDADGDSLPDFWEIANGLNPNDATGANGATGDPDVDGIINRDEFAQCTPPTDLADSDSDGLVDLWETDNFGDLTQDGTGDPDGDGAYNEDEETNGTNPNDSLDFADSDLDGLPDDLETRTWGNLTTASDSTDNDGDTFTDLQEYTARTDPADGSFSPGKARLRHRWSFNGGLADTVGGSDAVIVDQAGGGMVGGGGGNDPAFNGGTEVRLFGGAVGTSDFISLGNNLIGGTQHDLTIEIWATQYSARNWSRVYSFGSSTDEFVMCSWTRGTNLGENRVEFKDLPLGAQAFIDTNEGPAVFPTGEEHHIVVQYVNDGFGGTQMSFWKNPSAADDLGPADGTVAIGTNLANLVDNNNWLGRAQFGDDISDASFNEVRIWDGRVNPKALEQFHDQGADDASLPDADGDSLPDFWEVLSGLDPNSAAGDNGAFGDPDGDGMINRDEWINCTPPTNTADTDGDGLNDNWEIDNFGDIESQDGSGDPDGDRASNSSEEDAGTDPNDAFSFPDSDSDGLPDAYEVELWGDLVTASDTTDGDGDTYLDVEEYGEGTDPQNGNWSPVKAELLHRWSFNGDLLDSVGGSNAQILDADGNPGTGGGSDLDVSNPGEVRLFGGGQGNSDYVQLGTNLLTSFPDDVTIELWGTQHAEANWTRVFSFGSGTGEVLLHAWTRGTNLADTRVEWRNPGQFVLDYTEAPAVYPLGVEHHIMVTLDNNGAGATDVSLYKNPSSAPDLGAPVGTATAPYTLETFVDSVNWLGRSQFANDPTANASYNETRIYRGVLHPKVREYFHAQGPGTAEVPDADGDSLPDFWEADNGLSTASSAGDDGAFGDPDGDGFNNRDEFRVCSDPNDPLSNPDDTDGDGLPDEWELLSFGDLSQGPDDDFDGDCDTNLVEFAAGTDAADNFSFTDTDSDSLADSWEIKFFDDLSPVAGDDSDADGLGNLDEFIRGTDPTDNDTDSDGLLDGVESGFGIWNGPGDPGTSPLSPDTDGDGLPDGLENPDLPYTGPGQPGTDPNFADTDFDGFDDGLEVSNGSDPTDFLSTPLLVGTLVDTDFDPDTNQVTLSYLGLDQAGLYEVRASLDGVNFTPVGGTQFTPASASGSIQFTSDEQATPLQIFKLFQLP